jgi:hypothetical protein
MEGIMFNKIDFLSRLKNVNPWTKLAVVFFSAALVLVISSKSTVPAPPVAGDNEQDSLSTFIPAGQRIVPIEILNSDALDSILGRYGYVDLYLPGQRRAFARGVRIVKSIDSSGAWAAIVAETMADELIANGARFQVAVQPSKGHPTQTQRAIERAPRAIVYEGN